MELWYNTFSKIIKKYVQSIYMQKYIDLAFTCSDYIILGSLKHDDSCSFIYDIIYVVTMSANTIVYE